MNVILIRQRQRQMDRQTDRRTDDMQFQYRALHYRLVHRAVMRLDCIRFTAVSTELSALLY